MLILGDSLVGNNSGLEATLRKKLEANGAVVETCWEVGARVTTWSESEEIQERIKWAQTVIVVLGMNSSRTPPSTYGRHVREFDKALLSKSLECFWIGPPVLVENTHDFVDAMPETVTRHTNCKYFDTQKAMKFQPHSVSGFHVKNWKGKKWANKIWEWIHVRE